MGQLVFKIEVYEGPLDLLLSLIAKHKMDIKDIQISLIFDQYMAYVETLQKMDMEVAGEFITMASELMLIKSKMLLPKQEKDPREELVRVLMEYKSAKNAAQWLSLQEKNYAGRFEKDTDEIKPDKEILDAMDIHILSKALERMLLRMGEQQKEKQDDPIEKIYPIIKKQIVPVSVKVVSLLRFMYRRGTAHFEELFENAQSRSEIIAIFYATLELLKAGRLSLMKAVGDITNSNVILEFKMHHNREREQKQTFR